MATTDKKSTEEITLKSNGNSGHSDSHPKTDTENAVDKMTAGQIEAFRDIFQMFDKRGGGFIKSEDMDEALQSVDIKLTKEEHVELFASMDIDGNGVIDFDEFLQLVANTENYLKSIVTRNGTGKTTKSAPTHLMLFDAVAAFMKKSALASVNEIERYYHAQRMKHQSHLIGHYTAGARLIGLSPRQFKREMAKFTELTAKNKSPYAQPIVNSLDSFLEETRTKKLKKKEGTVSKKVRTLSKLPQLTVLPEMTYTRNGKKQTLQEKQAHPLTIDDMHLIRKQVKDLKSQFYKRVIDAKEKTAEKHWKELATEEIKSEFLREGIRKAFEAYTDYKNMPISSISSSYLKTDPLSFEF